MSVTKAEANGVAATSIVKTVAVAVGDMIWVATQGTSAGVPTISDDVNSGAYNNFGNYPGVSFDFLNLQWKRCNAAGIATISATGVAVDRIAFIHYNGFTGIATAISTDKSSGAQGTGATAALDSGSFNASVANEYAIGIVDNNGTGSGYLVAPTNMTNEVSFGGHLDLFDVGPVAKTIAVRLSATLNGTANWIAAIAGFYDAPGSHKVDDLVQETTATTGTGTITLAGAATGFRPFSAAMGSGDTCLYLLQSGSAWEIGIGTYTLGANTLARTQILKSSNSNAAISLTGTSSVSLTEPSAALWNKPVFDAGNSSTTITIDWANGPYQIVTLSAASPVISFANQALCPHGILEVYQDGTGSRVPTITGAVYRSGSAPTWATAAGAHDVLRLHFNAVKATLSVSAET